MIETVGVTLEKEKFECTEEAVGTIVEINNKKKKEAYIGIRYEVEEVDFLLKEYIQLKKEPIKFLFIPIWNKKVPVMGNYALGDKIVIKYNPEKPSEAYYPKNESTQQNNKLQRKYYRFAALHKYADLRTDF